MLIETMEKNKKVTAFILTLALVLGIFVMPVYGAGVDKTSLLMGYVTLTEVSQGGNHRPPIGPLDFDKEVKVKLQFNVPVIGDLGNDSKIIEDDSSTYIQHGDEALIPLADGFKLVSNSGPFDLEYKVGGQTVKIGSLRIVTSGTALFAQIDFDGDPSVFDGTGGWYDVVVDFNATLKYNGPGQGVNDTTQAAMILDKYYEIKVPKIPEYKSGEKRGEVKGTAVSGGSILWTVEVRNFNASGQAITFGAVEFYDNLTNVGKYIDGSFTIGTTIPGVTTSAVVYNTTTGELTFNLQDYEGFQYIQFETKIPSEKFFSGSGSVVSNSAILKEAGKDDVVMKDTVSFDFGWLRKKGAVEQFDIGSTTGSIRWTITANDIGASLNNAKIIDILPDGLKFVSANWTTYSAATNTWASPTEINPSSGAAITPYAVYELGDINTPVQLIIIAKVTKDIGHKIEYYTNTATIEWDGYGGIGSGKSTVGIGVNPIMKTAGKYDVINHEVPWTVTVSESDVFVDLYTMDLFVYGTTLSATSVDSIDVATASGTLTSSTGLYTNITLGSIKANIAKGANEGLVANINQKYLEGSFYTSGSGINLGYIVYTLKDGDGKAVADLLVVTNPTGGGMVVSPTAQKFEFKTKVTNPQIYASNKAEKIRNEVALFSANEFVSSDHATANYDGRMLAKDMLPRNSVTAENITETALGATSNGQGFNYSDHTVVFRLHVNANNLQDFTNDITTVDGVTVGAMTLTDTLPDGWEFVPIVSGGPMFYIYEGTPSAVQGKVDATGSAISPAGFMTANISEGATTAAFEFNELKGPYVILVRAKLTSEAALLYFSQNTDKTFKNTASLSGDKGYSKIEVKQEYSIINNILSKSQNKVTDGAVEWSIEYKPNTIGEGKTSVTAIDILPPSMDLRRDSYGNLIISQGGVANIKLIKLNLKTDGSNGYSNGLAENVQDYIDSGRIAYDVSTRALTWVISDPAIAYRLSYITDVTGDPGLAKNKVKLVSEWTTQGGVEAGFTVADKDVEATMKRGGWIEITKFNGTSGPAVSLAGIVFVLLAEDGSTVLRTGTTSADGTVSFRGLPENSSGGAYTLKETNFDTLGFKPLVKVYEINVKASGAALVTSINGEAQEITLYNYKTNSVGNVSVTKTLFGGLADPGKVFSFTINAPKAMGPFEYEIITSGGVVTTGIAVFTSTGYAFTLKGDQTIVFKDVPFETYTVNEVDYSSEDYVTYVDSKPTSTAAVTISSGTTTAGLTFQNSRAGWIEITKTDAAPPHQGLSGAGFTLFELDGTPTASGITGTDGKIRFNNIEIGEYYFKETTPPALYSEQFESQGIGNIKHYVTVVSDGGIKTVIDGVTTNAIRLINYKNATVGDLRIMKTLSGNNTSSTKDFEFTIVIPSMAGISASTIGSGGKADETITFSATGAATILLRGGQSLRLIYLPKGATYTVTETDYSADGYKTTISGDGDTGVISADAIKTVAFNNHKSKAAAPKVGNLTISKTVTGTGGDKDRSFSFQFRFPSDKTTSFSYTGIGVPNGTIKHGDLFTLKHGQSITINNLPAGGDYAVAEGDYSGSGYVTSATGASGTIEDGKTAQAKFTNRNDKEDHGKPGEDPDDDTGILGEDDEKNDGKNESGKDPDDTAGETDSKVPKTGDDYFLGLWIYLFALSLLGVIVLARRGRKA